ncbi:MAG: hypothetical protein RL736_307 [Pseudomonadota bacterium]
MKKPNENLIHAKAYCCGMRDTITLDGVQVFLADLLEGSVKQKLSVKYYLTNFLFYLTQLIFHD